MPRLTSVPSSKLQRTAVYAVFAAYAVSAHSFLLTTGIVPSEDLPGHLALISQIRSRLLSGDLLAVISGFYDYSQFSGWPALQFYASGAHLAIAITSLPLTPFTEHSAALAAHLWILLLLTCLPCSIAYCSSALIRPELQQQRLFEQLKLCIAVSSCVFTLWFLNNDDQYFGVGSGAVITVGLLPQIFAWHLLLLYLGKLLRELNKPGSHNFSISFILAALILTHTLTALFALALGAIVIVWTIKQRRSLLLYHLYALGLCAFWLLPLFSLTKQYTLPDPYPAQADLLRLMFRYPLHDAWLAIRTHGLAAFKQLNIAFFVVLAAAITGLISSEVRRAKFTRLLFAASLLLFLLFSSNLLAASLPLAVHYYRLQGYCVLVALVLISAIPALSCVRRNLSERSITLSRGALAAWSLAGAASILGCIYFPPLEREAAVKSIAGADYQVMERVLDYLNRGENRGRVLVEHLNDYRKSPYLSCHYLSANLPERTGREAVTGLFVESSVTSRFTAGHVARLDGVPFSPYLTFISNSSLSEEQLVNELRQLGVTHVVAGTEGFLKRLKPHAKSEEIIGPFHVIELNSPAAALAEQISVPLIGFYDHKGNLPFYLLEFYFSARSGLAGRFELAALDSLNDPPAGLSAMLINTTGVVRAETKGIPVLRFDWPGAPQINHYQRSHQPQRSILLYRSLEAFLDRLGLEQKLGRIQQAGTGAGSVLPQIETAPDEIVLEGLEPGRGVRINYSYFPLWAAQGGRIIRGSQERILAFPEQSKMTLTYSPFNSGWTWLGWLISACFLSGLLLRLAGFELKLGVHSQQPPHLQ